MNFLPTSGRLAFLNDGSIFWHGDGSFRQAFLDDLGAVSAATWEKTQANGRSGQQRSNRAGGSVFGR
jgi:hypothetical protein